MSATLYIVFAVAGLIISLIGLALRFARRDGKTKERLRKEAAEAADDMRRRAQHARTDHEETTPRLDDDELDAELERLRRATAAARKTR